MIEFEAESSALAEQRRKKGYSMKKRGEAKKKSPAKARKTIVKIKKKISADSLRSEYDFSEGSRGAVIEGGQTKLPITIRLDGAVLNFFRDKALAEGGGAKYQTLINEALKEYIQGSCRRQLI